MLVLVLILGLEACGDPHPEPVPAKPSEVDASVAPTTLVWTQPAEMPDDGTVLDLVGWNGSAIAVGRAVGGQASTGGVWRETVDGSWKSAGGHGLIARFGPDRVLALSDRLVLVAEPLDLNCRTGGACAPPSTIWTSEDGLAWEPADGTPLDGATIRTAVSDGAGAVLAGEAGGSARLWFSSDGSAWDPVQESLFEGNAVSDVDQRDGVYVAVGSLGKVSRYGVTGDSESTPAAWWSTDGLDWNDAQVDAIEAPGAEITSVTAFDGGFLAIGSDPKIDPAVGSSPLVGWLSSNGRSWERLGEVGTALPDATLFAAAEGGVVAFGRSQRPDTGDALATWFSSDGHEWRELDNVAPAPGIPDVSQSVSGRPVVESVFSVPGAIEVVGLPSGPHGELVWRVELQ